MTPQRPGAHDSAHHPPEHEENLLTELALSDDVDTALRTAGLQSCAECRAFAQGLRAVAQRLAVEGETLRDIEATAASQVPSAGEERAWQSIVASGTAEARRSSVRSTWWFAAAAALILALFLAPHLLPSRAPDPVLGPGASLVLLRPLGDSRHYAPFEWESDLPPNGWFVVRAEGRRASGESFSIESAHLTTRSWDPDLGGAENWPSSLRWTVESYDASGEQQAVASGTARRSDP